jgi:hypothetical protein
MFRPLGKHEGLVIEDGNLSASAVLTESPTPEDDERVIEALRAFYTFAVRWEMAGCPGRDDDAVA